MKPRERILAALSHEEPDRCPMQVSFTPEFADRLRADLQMKGQRVHNPHGGGNTYELERALGEDMLLTSVGWANSYYQQPGAYTDEWGIGWDSHPYETPFGTGHYTEIVSHPLADDQAILSYTPPDPNRPELYAEAERVVREFQGDYWIVGVTVTTIFETAWALRGLQQMLVDFVENPDLADAILEIPYQYHLTAAKKLVQMGVDMIWTGDDVGTQHAMLISPRHWRRFLKPRMAHFIAELKAINPALKVAYHSDGNILPVLDLLVAAGFEGFNPLEPRCGMDVVTLRGKYGRKVLLIGGVCNTQILPHGSRREIEAHVRPMLEMGRDGGLVLGAASISGDVPPESYEYYHSLCLKHGVYR